jgi:hypothetical protein
VHVQAEQVKSIGPSERFRISQCGPLTPAIAPGAVAGASAPLRIPVRPLVKRLSSLVVSPLRIVPSGTPVSSRRATLVCGASDHKSSSPTDESSLRLCPDMRRFAVVVEIFDVNDIRVAADRTVFVIVLVGASGPSSGITIRSPQVGQTYPPSSREPPRFFFPWLIGNKDATRGEPTARAISA